MRKYILDSIRKFKADGLSKIIYDIMKWLFGLLIFLISSRWIPYVKNLFVLEFSISLYILMISSVTLIVLTTIFVSRIFRKKIREIINSTHIDELTGLKNQKALEEYLNTKIQEYQNKSEPLSVIIIDIDDFKGFNTKLGHNIADQILRNLGGLLGNDKRATDETFRYFNKGDEFFVVAGETSLAQAIQAAERKRKLIQKNIFSVEGQNYHLTVCCGVTELKNTDDYTSLTNRVIEAMNEAKKIEKKNNTKSIV